MSGMLLSILVHCNGSPSLGAQRVCVEPLTVFLSPYFSLLLVPQDVGDGLQQLIVSFLHLRLKYRQVLKVTHPKSVNVMLHSQNCL